MHIETLGTVPYPAAWKLQHQYVEARANNEIEDTLLTLEHPHSITMGRKSPEFTTLKAQGATKWKELSLFMVERGGMTTYHGPGQIILYPIFRLPEGSGPKAFLRLLEKTVIQTLKTFNLDGYAVKDKTGVWIQDKQGRERKIASMGIAVRKSVTYHGLALNVTTDTRYFQTIQPCGFEPSVMVTMEELLEQSPSLVEVTHQMSTTLCSLFKGQWW